MINLSNKMRQLLGDQEEAFTDDERQYQNEWLFKNAAAVNRRILFISFWAACGAVLLGGWALVGEFRTLFCWSHAFAAAWALVMWLFAKRALHSRVLHLVILTVLVTTVAVASARTIEYAPDQSVAAFCILLALSLGLIRLAPLVDLNYTLHSAIVTWMICVLVLPWQGIGRQFLFIQLISLGVACWHERVRFKHILREAALELRMRRLQGMAERARATHEMALAKEIQESFSPPNEQVSSGSLSASWHQRQSEPLGGDWAAIKALGPERLVVVVADVTGKGVQAALVVHAVQSLWASGCNDLSFDPAAWISQLNATLFHLGRRHKQTLTLGLADISPKQVTYWSAGHLPLFLVQDGRLDDETADERSAGSVKAIAARGGMIGLEEDIELRPATWEFDRGDLHLLLGTDGIFTAGRGSQRAQILAMARNFAKAGEGVLDRPEFDDDRTLVVVRRAA